MFVALLTLGSVLFWGLSRSGVNLFGQAGQWGIGTNELALQGANSSVGSGTASDASNGGDAAFNRLNRQAEGSDNPAGSTEANGSLNAPSALSPEAEANGQNPGENARTQGIPTIPNFTGSGSEADDLTALPTQSAQPAQLNPIEPVREALLFQDVPEGYWAKPYIDALSARGLIQGFENNTFRPDEPVTRAQFAKLITQAFILNPTKAAIAFNDLAQNYWAAEAIDDAVKGGFMNGFPDFSFKPDQSVTRVQTLTALVTGLNTNAAGDPNASVQRYADNARIPTWAVGKVAAATQSGIVINYPQLDTLAPNQPTTRAEAAAMIYQALVYQGRLEPIDSAYLVKP
jgi:S-layer homology domain